MAPEDDPLWQKSHDDDLLSRKLKEYYPRSSSTTPPAYSTMPFPDPPAEATGDAASPTISKSKPPYGPPSVWWNTLETTASPTASITSTSSWTTKTMYPQGAQNSKYMTNSASQTTTAVMESTDTPEEGFGPGRPGWPGPNQNNGAIYAAAAVTPVIVLAIIGLIVFFCLRKRRRQQRSAGVAQEMKMSSNPRTVSVQPYIAPPPVASPQYAPRHQESFPSTANQNQPVILGPISSGANGAYLTGIDTSDVVSMTSDNHLTPAVSDPFADNNSLSEPPPPYRPRSAGPPSFVTHSRQSSVRSAGPLAPSQTHLIRSPFDDPADDDVVSEVSGPTAGRAEDAMSAVSDLSYQHDVPLARTSLRPT